MTLIQLLAQMNHRYLYQGTVLHNVARLIAGLEPIDIIIDIKTNYGTAVMHPGMHGRIVNWKM